MAKKRILVVDDELNIRRLVQVNLEAEGYIVEEAVDGIEGLEKIRANPPDLIVLDIMMPRMDGTETMKEIQADPKLQEIPVIFLTAKAQDKDVFIGWQSGCACYLTKPFNPRELKIFARRILEAQERPHIDSEDGETVWEV